MSAPPELPTIVSRCRVLRLRPLPPPRGLIYDRQGILLAENLPSFRLEIVPETGAPAWLGRLETDG